ncbi:MAG: alpha/beta hydrolase, partial [Rhodothermales bacterium]|nr:alpha/beta hydrolase [Rhodothermales bacterium]
TPGHHELLFEPVSFETSDGQSLAAWWLPSTRERGVLLFLHGNAGNMADRIESLKILNRLGLSVFIFDYRGYGTSTGEPSENGLYEDGESAWRYLTETRGVDPMKIVIFGRSLGGGVATWLASRHSSRAVILESPFTSVHDLISHHYPFVPVQLLINDRYDSLSRIHSLQTGALLMIHSPEDELVPFVQGQELFKAARGNKEFLEIEGTHNHGYIAAGERYVEAIDAFLDTHLAP